jgi:hypothetical protein
MAGEIGGDDAEYDDQRIDDLKVVPLGGKAENAARPVPPVELIFFKNVNAIGGSGEPEKVGQRHRALRISLEDRVGMRNLDCPFLVHRNVLGVCSFFNQ